MTINIKKVVLILIIFMNSKLLNYDSNKFTTENLKKSIRTRMSRHDSSNQTFYRKMIKLILHNQKNRLVANFKDYLIYDDLTEFFRRYF